MQYQLSIRKIKESDLSINRLFMAEDEAYDMYLSAFIEDVQNLECVTKVETNGNGLVVTIEKESDFEQLHAAVKHLLNNSFHDKLVSDSGFSKVA